MLSKINGIILLFWAIFSFLSILGPSRPIGPFTDLSGPELYFKIFLAVRSYFGRLYNEMFACSGIAFSFMFFFMGLSEVLNLKKKFATRGILLLLLLFVNVLFTGGVIQHFWPGTDLDLGGSIGIAAFKVGSEFITNTGMIIFLLFLWTWFFLNLSGRMLQEILLKWIPGLFPKQIDVKVSEGAKEAIGGEKDQSLSLIDRKREKNRMELGERVPEIRMICQKNIRRGYRYRAPSVTLLEEDTKDEMPAKRTFPGRNREALEEKLQELGIRAQIVDVHVGPLVSLFEIRLEKGTKLKQIEGVMNDLSLAMGTPSLRYVGILPGKGTLGIEVPNLEQLIVPLGEILRSSEKRRGKGGLEVPFGATTTGEPHFEDIVKMPHLLIAGATGSGKSVFIHSLIISLLSRYYPEHFRLLLIDPKFVELSIYNGIPHLLHPAITAPQDVLDALSWLIYEMERRYEILANIKARDIEEYNSERSRKRDAQLPYIMLIIDELADLMLTSGDDFEKSIVRLAQKARATGIHLILATQRPSVDVISGLTKANFPSRIAFKVSTQVDSRVILDEPGAEKLLGRGDMLFRPPTAEGLIRLHGAYIHPHLILKYIDSINKTLR